MRSSQDDELSHLDEETHAITKDKNHESKPDDEGDSDSAYNAMHDLYNRL
jgi:hypothetical protein